VSAVGRRVPRATSSLVPRALSRPALSPLPHRRIDQSVHHSFAEKTKQLSGGRGADVIYDGIGHDAAQENLAALAMRGHWVSYGHATGALEPLNLGAKSGTLSHPVLFHYTEDSLQQMAGRTFAALRDGVLRPDVRHRYPLAAAADAHRDLEARRTTGQIVLLP